MSERHKTVHDPLKWGWCYHNREDPRVWAPKKNSAAGFTLNFAHRQAYAILVLLLIAPIMIVLLIELLK